MSEPDLIKSFDKLMLEPLQSFPTIGERLNAPKQPGVYVIYDAKEKVRYVGLVHGVGGLRQRLMTHSRDSTWFKFKYGRRGGFRCLVVDEARQRELLGAYTEAFLKVIRR
jgi:hypothetical protein